MIFRIIAILFLLLVSDRVYGAECTAYQTLHPRYPLTGAHLSTGKCTTCSFCHVPAGNAVWIGTPNTCIGCHNGNPSINGMVRSAKHLPTLLLDCAGCHNTTAFNSFTGITQTMIHNTGYPTVRCDGCHNGNYTSYNAQGKGNGHPTTVTKNGVKILVTSVDCNYCHSPNSSQFDD